MERGKPTRTPAARALESLGVVLAAVVAGLLLLELGCRLLRGGPPALADWHNLVLAARVADRKAEHTGPPSYVHHPALGFVNNADFASQRLNYDAQGFRRMPPLAPGAVRAPPILATGDSYTKGDEVADLESWPARLQDILAWRTINAGVGAYGLDQTVLLTERLARELKPAAIVLGFIADDVRRTEMHRMWGREKPYFDTAMGLHNVPVPLPPDPRDTLTPLDALVGWSVLADIVADRLRWRDEWHMDHARALPHGAGEQLACPLMRRIAATGVPTLVVAQYLPSAWDVPESAAEERRVAGVVLACAAQAGLATVDVWPLFAEAIREDGRNAVYAQWHPNPRGYRLIADAVATELRRRKLLP